MAHRRRVAFVGWSPAQWELRGNVLPPPFRDAYDEGIFEDGRIDEVAGAVIGDLVLGHLDPEALVEVMEGTETPFCLFALDAPRDVRGRWHAARLTEKFANGDLKNRVRDWMRDYRPTPHPSDWLTFEGKGGKRKKTREPLPPDLIEFVETIQDIPKCKTAEWAKAANTDRHRLLRQCKLHGLGSPEAVIWDWFEHSVRLLRRKHGVTLEDVAALYGYSNGGSVHRAFQRRGCKIPPRNADAPPLFSA